MVSRTVPHRPAGVTIRKVTTNHALMTARTRAGLSQGALARRVRETGHQLGMPNECNRSNISRWEHDGTRPQAHYVVLLEKVLSQPASALGFGADEAPPALLGPVPGSFSATALGGDWLTAYTFDHGGAVLHHADIARVLAESDRAVSAVNGPAVTEGRAVPFGNVIEAQLSGRHLLGQWRNTSDTRYFGTLHLAVLPGETVMDGYYTGLASDIAVSTGRWRWVRLGGQAEITLRDDPHGLYDLAISHQQTDAPLTAADIRGDS
jgi:transcriptional regulator with XRE-family HTH domain